MGCIGFLIFGIALGLIAITWPVCWWSAVAGSLAYILHRLIPEEQAFISRVLTALRNSTLAVLIALTVLAVGQIILLLGSEMVEPKTVRSWETGFAHYHFMLKQIVDIKLIITVTSILIAVQLVAKVPVLPHMATIRKWISRGALALITLSSFSFLYTVRSEGMVVAWRAHLEDGVRNLASGLPSMGRTRSRPVKRTFWWTRRWSRHRVRRAPTA